jgi:hypothetical protein
MWRHKCESSGDTPLSLIKVHGVTNSKVNSQMLNFGMTNFSILVFVAEFGDNNKKKVAEVETEIKKVLDKLKAS